MTTLDLLRKLPPGPLCVCKNMHNISKTHSKASTAWISDDHGLQWEPGYSLRLSRLGLKFGPSVSIPGSSGQAWSRSMGPAVGVRGQGVRLSGMA